MKRFDKVRLNNSCSACEPEDISYEVGPIGTVLGLCKDDNFQQGVCVIVKLDEPLMSEDGFEVKVQTFAISMLEVINGDS